MKRYGRECLTSEKNATNKKRNCICIRPLTIGLTVVHHKPNRWNCHRLWNGQGTQVFEQMSVRALSGIRGAISPERHRNKFKQYLFGPSGLPRLTHDQSGGNQKYKQQFELSIRSYRIHTNSNKCQSVLCPLMDTGEASPDSHEIRKL